MIIKTGMLKQKIISSEELSNYGSVSTMNEQASALVKQQRETWELARKNYTALSEVQTREFDFGHFKIIAQHNPGRIRSSAAKVDAQSIARRPCFLCPQNLPDEQKAILFQDKFLILVNPFPVFPVHLTIPLIEHKPQEIYHFFPDMLELSRELKGFTVFYNGPQCGASAPDHFHFQAGNIGFLPIENELEDLVKNHSEILVHKPGLKIAAVKNYLRRFVCIASSDRAETLNAFYRVYSSLPEKNGNEPMMNILCFFEKEEWRVIIFPREKLRPSHFYKEDKNQVVVSPAAVELGGVIVLPRQKDFGAISNQIISEIYNEVTIPSFGFEHLTKSVSNAYR
jgi:ATP adenylyltransferase/5',5'''-P-1,P-4-tetraphosphate phosphorylase II